MPYGPIMQPITEQPIQLQLVPGDTDIQSTRIYVLLLTSSIPQFPLLDFVRAVVD